MNSGAPLIATKLHVPKRRASTIERPRLTARLSAPARLSIVAAPAGFGKTSVLSEWVAAIGARRAVAWVSLDERDGDPELFWSYVLAALGRAVPSVADSAMAELQSRPGDVEAMLATLVNELDAGGHSLVLVLDDYHAVESAGVQSGMTFLLDNLPPSVQVVIGSRADPALALAKLRTRGQLVELRAADLRFTVDEAQRYLREVMAVDVDDSAAAALTDRTEGWIAAIQLAALSLQGRDDAASFIASFAGDDRFVVDYLVEEVLNRQPAALRDFLLTTSVLTRLTGELCDAVTASSGGAATLEALDRANLFLVPLDERREWYRYQHLFAEMLRARLVDERPGELGELHRRASEWLEARGRTAEAIVHALDGGHFEKAADLIALAMPAMHQSRQEQTLVRWFEQLPPQLIRSRPALCIGFAGTLLSAGRTDGVDELLRQAESAIGSSDETRAIRSGIALYGAAQALTSGDLDRAVEQANSAVGLASDRDHLDRGSANGILGLVLWARGDLNGAEAAWVVSLDELQRAGHLSDVLGGSIAMADIQRAQGRLTDAHDTYQRALAMAGASADPLRGAADMHVGLGDLLRERGDFDGARRHLAAADALGEYAGLPQNRHRRRIALALLAHSAGDYATAISLLGEAERLYTPDFFPDVRPIAALRARAQLAAGAIDDALAWARRSGLSPDDELNYLREFEHLTLARVLAASPGGVDAALGLIERIIAAAAGRGGSLLSATVLQSVLLSATGQTERALDALESAAAAAEGEGNVRVFADEGQPMARMLAALAKRSPATAFRRRVLAAIENRPNSAQPLADPLSNREIDVLRMLMSELGGPDIARQLSISLNTLRTHTKNIYLKLGVSSRREAVAKAASEGILRPPR